VSDDLAELNALPMPKCPRCANQGDPVTDQILKELQRVNQELDALRMQNILESRKAPAQVGSNFARAFDYANEAAMHDFGLTNLRDTKIGEDSAPNLAPERQHLADNMTNGKADLPIMGDAPKGAIIPSAAQQAMRSKLAQTQAMGKTIMGSGSQTGRLITPKERMPNVQIDANHRG